MRGRPVLALHRGGNDGSLFMGPLLPRVWCQNLIDDAHSKHGASLRIISLNSDPHAFSGSCENCARVPFPVKMGPQSPPIGSRCGPLLKLRAGRADASHDTNRTPNR